jgi:dsDNA-specific endonuclease/ATPase MutS2
MKSHAGTEEYRSLVSDIIERLSSKLGLGEKSLSTLVKDALENARAPFSFSTYVVNKIVEELKRSKAEASYREYIRVSRELSKYVGMLGKISEELYEFDLVISIYEFKKDYRLTFPKIIEGGIGFIGGRNIFLVQDELRGNFKIQKVNYSIGSTGLEIFGANTTNIVLLTGANSGGKTTLLTTVAQVATLSVLGLPVPVDKVEAPIISVYLFRRRTVRKIGSLEHALKSTIPILAKREKKLILMDEFEALTEPKAIARIVAVFLNNLPKQSLALFVTHLAGDMIPYLKTNFRVDGIEATGINAEGNLMVDRQPTFNRLGTSSPELIVQKLQKTTRSKRVAKTYGEMLELLRHLRGGRSPK